jgi:integrase
MNAPARGGRPATGSIVWEDPETKTKPIGVRVTKTSGKRALVRFDPGTTSDAAISLAPILAERARHAVDESAGPVETVADYGKRWIVERERRGLASVSEDRRRLNNHVNPALGVLPIREVTRVDLLGFVERIDRRVRAGDYGWKTAQHIWSNVRTMFRDACGSKLRELRVREDDPATGVQPPDRGVSKAKQYLYPSELLTLVSCERVPLRWRRVFALGAYLYMRPGELEALRWEDVDLDHGIIHVHRAIDCVRAPGVVKPTKTKLARKVPIEPMIAPLLAAMRAERRGRGRVLAMPSDSERPRKLRKYLARAGVKRTELFKTEATRRAITFYDATRATGITWMAVRGAEPLRIMQRAGHTTFDTTLIYIREAENFRIDFGAPFPPLPASLLGSPKPARKVSASVSAFGVARLAALRKTRGFGGGAQESNQPETRPRTTRVV